MPSQNIQDRARNLHSEDMQDIITAVPSWLLRWGITIFFLLLILIIALSAFIRYPDIVKTQLKITSPNSPKPIISKISGKLVKVLVKNNDFVSVGQPLAYMESTADHAKVLMLLLDLKEMQSGLVLNKSSVNYADLSTDKNELGELQPMFQIFSQAYTNYKSSINDGFLLQKRKYLQKDIISIRRQAEQLNAERDIQQQDFKLADAEYNMHKKLAKEKVETPAELRQQESKFLSKKAPIIQTEAALINSNASFLSKQKEILELDNQINEEKLKFIQALNSLISQFEDWKAKYVLSTAQSGRVVFAGVVQENQMISSSQDIFYINSGNNQYYGEMPIPQTNLGKVEEGQEVLIKLRSYPYEEYGMLRGKIGFISSVPYRDSVFIAKVLIELNRKSDLKKNIQLKSGMIADAEIITEDATIFERLVRNFTRTIKSH